MWAIPFVKGICQAQLPHCCTYDSSKAAENCGVPKPPPICGAKNRRPSEGFFALTDSTTVGLTFMAEEGCSSAGGQKSRLCHDFCSVASSKLPQKPREVWCLRNLRH